MDSTRETWHKETTIRENVGASNTERIISVILPGSKVKCTYPPKGLSCDISCINLYKEWERVGKDLYPTFEKCMEDFGQFLPFERYEQKGIYTNLYYEKWVYAGVVNLINKTS